MIILYTGIGCNKTGIHTVNEFLNIMNTEFTHKTGNTNSPVFFNGFILPDDFVFFTLQDWIEYSGANYQIDKIDVRPK
jgi:hypothetical protein